MKRLARVFLLTSIIALTFVIFGCSNSYENMIEKFDSKFFTPEPSEKDAYSGNSSNFNPLEMLSPGYVFSEGYFISLEAPDNCSSYLWTCTNSEVNKKVISTKQTLYYEIPGVFKVGEPNTLILTVTAVDEQGSITEYIDESVIIIKAQKNLD